MNEIGYHGTCSKHKDSIESNGFDPAKCNYRADHWLGQGVYFFDDYEKALWWSATAVLHNNDFGRVIFRATIEAPDEEVLDLDDNKQLDAFFAEIIQCIDEIKKIVLEICLYLMIKIFVLFSLIIISKKRISLLLPEHFRKIMQVIQCEETRRIKNYRRK